MSDNTSIADAISNRRRPEAAIIVVPTDPLTALALEVRSLKQEIEELRETTAKERASDRQRIAALEKTDPQPAQEDRGKVLRALLAANGCKMLAKDARKVMRLDESTFSKLLDTLGDFIEIKPFRQDKRNNLLTLKSKVT